MKLPIALALGTMALALSACTSGLRGNTPAYWGKELPPANAPLSRAYKEVIDKHYATFPPKEGECAKEIHARYWVYGPDGKVYPTWHPPVDPQTGCKFGHEHGHDPRESALYNGMPPFGYVNEKHFEYKDVNAEGYQGNFRDEDHVGHKIELQNNFTVYSDAGFAYTRCSVNHPTAKAGGFQGQNHAGHDSLPPGMAGLQRPSGFDPAASRSPHRQDSRCSRRSAQ